ncbi:Ribosome maturation protein SBDS [Dirofilaria immitis]
MANRIKTPTNVKLLTNVAVVRMKKCGKRFEIACYKNKVISWRNKTEKDIDEVLQTQTVFINVSKGQVAKREELNTAFGTDDQLEICKIILEKGDLQVSEKERQAQSDSSFKEIANLISNMCVNPDTKRPYSSSVIESALHETHLSLKPNRSVKQQALEIIPKLRESIKIDRAEMRLRVSVEAKEAKRIHDRLKGMFTKIEVEDWDQGSLEMVGLIDPGAYRSVEELLQKETKKTGHLELLALKVISEAQQSFDTSSREDRVFNEVVPFLNLNQIGFPKFG